MKLYLFLFILSFAAISCEVDQPESIENETDLTSKSSIPHREVEAISHNDLLVYMAFLTGETIKNDPLALSEFTALKGNSTTVDLYDLLNEQTQASNFRATFKQMYQLHLFTYELGRPDDPYIRPPSITDFEDDNSGGILPINQPLQSDISFNMSFDFLTNQNCTELYIPNALQTNGNYHLLTAGHPMDLSTDHFAMRIIRTHVQTGNNPNNSTPNAVFDEISYADNHNGENIIVCRPEVTINCQSTSGIPAINYDLFVATPFRIIRMRN